MATIKEINHDSSTTLGDHYDTVTDTENRLSVTIAAALRGSTNGVNVNYTDETVQSTLLEAFTFSSNDFRMRFRIKLDNLINNSAGVNFLRVQLRDDSGSNLVFQVELSANPGDSGFNVTATAVGEGKGGSVTLGDGTDAVPSTGDVCIELRGIKEVSSSSNDGEVELYVNGVSIDSDLTMNNFNIFGNIDSVRVVFETDTDIDGTLSYDEWILDDNNAATALCSAVGFDLVIGGGQT